VIEIELNLVRRRTNRLITSELELFNEILVRVLGHASALISVKEDIVNVERSSNKRLVVGSGYLDIFVTIASITVKIIYSPQALINGTDVKVDLDFVILKSDEGKGKTGIAAIPELERHVESRLRKSIAGSANLARSIGITWTINIVERRIRDES